MSQDPHRQTNDIEFVERRSEPRIIVSAPARYFLTNKVNVNTNRREFEGRVINISLHALTLFAPVTGAIGEHVVVHCDEFGILEGSISRLLDRAFVMLIDGADQQRLELAAKIRIYEEIKNHEFSNRRENKRIIPKNPQSTLIFADNSRVDCIIIDISTSGVAVSADIKPEIGTPLAVGSVVGRVVRHLPCGFAVQFVQLQNIDGLT